MSSPTPSSSASSSAPTAAVSETSGIRAVLRYSGIPPSLLRVPKFRLPSRNWLIFLGVSGSLASLFIYDRRECKRIRREACEQVRWMADLPLDPQATVKCIKVLAAKQPGDDESAKGMLYFRKWVKPILVAAAVDYDMIVGERHGSITNLVSKEIQHKRLIRAGFLQPDAGPTPSQSAQARQERELQGGVVLVGRATFKEYLEGLKRGYGEPASLGRGGRERGEDEEDALVSKALEGDGVFDEPHMADSTSSDSDSTIGTPQPVSPQLQSFRNPLLPSFELRPLARLSPSPSVVLPPETSLPPQPALLLLPFRNLVGISLIPRQIWGFFNRRYYAKSGAESALILLKGATRPFDPETDLEFGKDAEGFWPGKFDKVDEEVAKRKAEYYKELTKKLATARELANGTHKPTKEEERNPPKTEQELRQERFDKEKRWKRELEGWEVVKRSKRPAWEQGWEEQMRVFEQEGVRGAI
ncbi:hypothetical protein DACRYDRAFT_80937 [Dacryopinax primogenitus]|uniref:Mitochondrial import inner membrane translocase subunit TIM54 n=1 Tax=Dacryopinax primogenitus (strain DJM 731) TaxID=1858805 RepID=M5FWI8_DACPD|nr:uncharacterized protein DACRYDRAFT_80937 [Dacryopinax primogenitus]EJU00739.1 hypothetical protein DACRYDRAFT_80937 [Dacryopinax primogenitus]